MVRRIRETRWTTGNRMLARLECGHIQHYDTVAVQNQGIRIHSLVCVKCADALLLPDTLKEIWVKYWFNKQLPQG